MASDKKTIFKGIQLLAFALPLLFIGPSIIYNAFKNQGHFLYYPVLILGIICCVLAMFFMFKGVKTMTNGLFNEKK
jgi:hypothetical protein